MTKIEIKEKTKKSAESKSNQISNFFIAELQEYPMNEDVIEFDDDSR